MIYAINRYSNSRKPATADPKAANFHANIEADTPEEALDKSGLRAFAPNFRDRGANTLLLAWAATGAEIWVRPAMPGVTV